MEDFKDSVKKGFTACKSDIEFLRHDNSSVKDKVFSLESENNELKGKVSDLDNEIAELRAEIKGLKIAIDYIKEFSSKQQVTESKKVEPVAQETYMQATEFSSVYPSSINVETQNTNHMSSVPAQKQIPVPKDPYEALLAFKAKANKREVLKQKMISMISDNGMNLSELNFMFVTHFRYCSRATFYNYLKELELERKIRIERENSKNFVYLSDGLYREI